MTQHKDEGREGVSPAGRGQPKERVYVQHGSQPQGKWVDKSVNLPPVPWKQIGNLLDHWEQVNNDFKCQLQDDFPALYRSIEQLLITVENGDTVCMGCVSDGKEPHTCPDGGDSVKGEGETAPVKLPTKDDPGDLAKFLPKEK